MIKRFEVDNYLPCTVTYVYILSQKKTVLNFAISSPECHILTDFRNFLTFPPHLYSVGTLPCKIISFQKLIWFVVDLLHAAQLVVLQVVYNLFKFTAKKLK